MITKTKNRITTTKIFNLIRSIASTFEPDHLLPNQQMSEGLCCLYSVKQGYWQTSLVKNTPVVVYYNIQWLENLLTVHPYNGKINLLQAKLSSRLFCLGVK